MNDPITPPPYVWFLFGGMFWAALLLFLKGC